jgi:hypothetical protein
MITDYRDDIKNDLLPKNLENYKKGPDELSSGQRIGWWFQEDEEYAKKWEDGIRGLKKYPPFQGVVVPVEDIEFRLKYDPENLLVVMDQYPVEKCNCEITFIAYKRLVNNEELMQIIEIK